MQPKFSLEPATLELIEAAIPLFVLHYEQIAHFKDIKLAPDYATYLQLQEIGMLRFFTAREESGELIGYAIFFVKGNLHYKESLQAVQDVLFIHPDKRGFGSKFIPWCDEQLKLEGVQVVYHHVKVRPDLNFGPLLDRLGYQMVDQIYAKRLDKEGA